MKRENLNKIINYINKQPITCGLLHGIYLDEDIHIDDISISLRSRRLEIHKRNKDDLYSKLIYDNLTTLEYESLKEAIDTYRNKCIEAGGKALMTELGLEE